MNAMVLRKIKAALEWTALPFGVCARSGFTPWRRTARRVMLSSMPNKNWLLEMEVAACLVAVAVVALALMLGNTAWKTVTGK